MAFQNVFLNFDIQPFRDAIKLLVKENTFLKNQQLHVLYLIRNVFSIFCKTVENSHKKLKIFINFIVIFYNLQNIDTLL